MSEYSDPPPPSGAYTGPPPTGYGPPPQPGHPYTGGQGPGWGRQGSGWGTQAPGWGYPPPYPMGYVAPVYAGGYAPIPPGERRPGTLTAAAVLGYVNAGLLILMGIVLFSTTSIVDNLNRYDYYDHQNLGTEFAIDAVLNLLAGGLLIGGAVAMTNRTALGRVLYSVGAAIVIAESIYWISRWGAKTGGGYLDFYALLFAAIAIVGLCLAWFGGASSWLNRSRSAAGTDTAETARTHRR